MLKLMAEIGVGLLSFYAIKDRVDTLVKPEPAGLTPTQRVIHHTKEGGVAATLGIGAGVLWPVTAPIGAYKLGRDIVRNRHEIVEFVKDMPSSARSTYQHARDRALSMIRREKQVDAPPSDIAQEVALALEAGSFEPGREYVEG